MDEDSSHSGDDFIDACALVVTAPAVAAGASPPSPYTAAAAVTAAAEAAVASTSGVSVRLPVSPPIAKRSRGIVASLRNRYRDAVHSMFAPAPVVLNEGQCLSIEAPPVGAGGGGDTTAAAAAVVLVVLAAVAAAATGAATGRGAPRLGRRRAAPTWRPPRPRTASPSRTRPPPR